MFSLINKYVLRGTLAPLLFVTCLLTPAQATSFNWSYEFADGTKAEGMLEGTMDPVGSNVVVVTAMMGTWTGDPFWKVDTVDSASNIVTVNGEFFDLIVDNSGDPGDFLVLDKLRQNLGVAILFNNDILAVADDPLAPERWSLTAKTLDTPAPWTLMLLGGTGMLGLLAWARRRDKRLAAI